MFRLTKLTGDNDGTFGLPYNDVAVEDYCFLDVISQTADAASLAAYAMAHGLTPCGDARTENLQAYRSGLKIAAAIPVATDKRENYHCAIRGLGWVEIPETKWVGIAPRAQIGPVDDSVLETVVDYGTYSDLGVADYGEDTEGKAAVIISGWDFYHLLPLLGYTWQSLLTHLGVAGDEPEPFGFEDDSASCMECNVIDHRDDGYTYNFRDTPAGNYVGVNCGCYDDACRDEWADNANDAGKAIELDLARDLAREGKLVFVARYIGGMTDPGRGGYFRVGEHEPDYTGHDDRGDVGIVCNGEPEKIMADLRDAEPDTDFIMSHDESGQFQTYFSVWRVLDAE